ncbi:MAG TPA: choice-of-anchor Q domain-containing protein [Pirellulales bacterium]|nr:choice-of-anchor Q domain-containing protein [Pirellulales bacterium]
MFGNFRSGRDSKRVQKDRSGKSLGRSGRLLVGRSRVPVFELLELRALLTGMTYSPAANVPDSASLQDNNLRSAISAFNSDAVAGPATIQLTSGTYTLSLGQLDINNANHTLLIIGAGSTGPNPTIIDQTAADRLFQIESGVTVVFENLEIKGGTAVTDAGGKFTAAEGGGILNNGGNVTLNDVLVDHNEAVATVTGTNAEGGGVFSTGPLIIENGSQISNNTATIGAAVTTGATTGAGEGGGIFSNTASSVQIAGSMIANNFASGGTGVAATAAVVAGPGGAAAGGGVWIGNTSASPAVLSDDTIRNNSAQGGVGGAGFTTTNVNGGAGGAANGGGVFIQNPAANGAVAVTNSTISGNIAQGGSGGAAGTAAGTVGNGGAVEGGGINVNGSGSKLLNDTVVGNSAIGGNGTVGGNGTGGGIDDEIPAAAGNLGALIVNVTVNGNAAQGGSAPTLAGTPGTGAGGGIFNNDAVGLVLENTLVAANTADAADGPDFYGSAAVAIADDNLISNDSGDPNFASLKNPGSIVGSVNGLPPSPVNTALGLLQNNGGNTQTMALKPTSLAIGAGDPSATETAFLSAGLPLTDQRGTGFPRIIGTSVDIGAFQTQPAPVVTASVHAPVVFVLGDGVAIDPGITISSADADLTSATVTIAAGTVQPSDTLSIPAANLPAGITQSFASGVLTLSGSATPAQYQTALQSVEFSTTSTSLTPRSISIVVSDSSASPANSNPVTETVDVKIDPPTVTPSTNPTGTFALGGAAVAIDSGVTVTSADPTITGATMTINNFQTGDVLNFASPNGAVSGLYNSATGVLTLTGSASAANYQSALQSVTFSTTSLNTTPRSISVVALDTGDTGPTPSNTGSETVDVKINPPVVGPASSTNSFTLGGSAVAVDSAVTLTSADPDITGATVTIVTGLTSGDTLSVTSPTGSGIIGTYSVATGTLTLSGSATLVNYQAALASVTFSTTNTSLTPRSIAIVADDSAASPTASNTAGATVSVTINPPVVTASSPVVTPSGASSTFTVGGAAAVVDLGVALASSDTLLTGAKVMISAGTLQTGDLLSFTSPAGSGITGSFLGGVLTLSGTAAVASYQAALQSVTFSTTSLNTTARSISVVALDSAATPTASNAATETVGVVIAPPVMAAPSVAPSTFTVGGPAVEFDAGGTVTSFDTHLTSASMTISSGFQSADTLIFTNQNGITGNYGNGVLTLTGSATPAQYQAALASVTFFTTSTSITPRSISIVALDGSALPTAGNTAVATVDVVNGTQAVNLSADFNVTAITTDSTPFGGGGMDGAGNALSEAEVGSSVIWNGVTFPLGPANQPDVVQALGQTLALPQGNYSLVQYLAVGTNGNQSGVTFTVNYTTGSPTTVTQSISDWSVTTAGTTLISNAGQQVALTTAFRNTSTGNTDNSGPFDVYGFTIPTDPTRVVESITLPYNNDVKIVAIAVNDPPVGNPPVVVTLGAGGSGGSPSPSTPTSGSTTQVNLSGQFNLPGITAAGAHFTGGLDGQGNALSASALGSTLTWNGTTFNLAPAGADDVVQAVGQTINVPSGSYSQVELLATGVNGNQANQTFTVHYTDGTSKTITQSISDWHMPQGYAGESIAASTSYRNTSSGGTDSQGPFNVYAYSIPVDNSKTVSSITLPNNKNVAVLSISAVA